MSSGEVGNYSEFIEKYKIIGSTNFELKTSQIFVTDEIHYKYKYRQEFFIVTGMNELSDLPTFMRIIKIFVSDYKHFVIGEKWTSNFYCETYHAYSVQKDDSCVDNFFLFDLNNLSHLPAYELHSSYGNIVDSFIVPKYLIFVE